MSSRTLLGLRTLQAQFLSTDLDNSAGAAPTSGDQNGQINWALELIGKKCNLVGFANLTLVAGTSTYDLRTLSPRIVVPITVYINSDPLRNAANQGNGVWSMGELEYYHPTWPTDGQDTPSRAVFYNYSQLMLHPAPDAATAALSAGANRVFGTYLPAALSADGDIPDLPSEIHEAIAFLAAVNASMPMVTESEAWTRLQQFNNYWTQVVDDLAGQNARTMQTWNTVTDAYSRSFMRT